MTFRTRLVLFFIFITIIPIIGLSIIGLNLFRTTLTNETLQRLQAVVSIQESRINSYEKRNIETLRLFTNRLQLRVELEEYLNSGKEDSLDFIVKLLQTTQKDIPEFQEIYILNPSGEIIASTLSSQDIKIFPHFSMVEKAVDAYLPAVLFKSDDGKSSQYMAGPLVYKDRLLGIVVIKTDISELNEIFGDYTGFGQTGETAGVIKKANGDALTISPLRFNPNASLSLSTPASDTARPATRALKGIEDIFSDTVDYRKQPVFAATRYVENLQWGLIAKIDKAEVLAPMRKLQKIFIIILLFLFCFLYFISKKLGDYFSKPITELTKAAKGLSKGETPIVTGLDRKDELGLLARTFNSMSSDLRKSYTTLEQKVHERTLDLEQAKAKDEAILASLGDGLAFADESGKLIYLNKIGAEILGADANKNSEDTWQETYGVFDAVTKKPFPAEQMPLIRAVHGETVVKVPIFIRNANSPQGRYISVTATPIFIKGKSIGGVAVFRDITKENEIDRAKSEFVSLASHQLRTPLSAINWYAEMLIAGDAGALNTEQTKYMNEIYTGNHRMVELVNALLNVSRLDLGTFTIEPKPIDIVLLAKSVVHELVSQIKEKELSVEEIYDTDIPLCNADEKLLRMVYQNLFSNAVKYTPSGGEIKIEIHFIEKEGFHIKVTDTGIGISKGSQSKIFTKLFRADNALECEAEGTGLGLYIVKAIADQSGGKIWFESEEKKGTVFHVTFPLEGMKVKSGTRKLD